MEVLILYEYSHLYLGILGAKVVHLVLIGDDPWLVLVN
jgi:hypothetical protein